MRWAPAIYVATIVAASIATVWAIRGRGELAETLWACRISGYAALALLATSVVATPVARMGRSLRIRVSPSAVNHRAKHSGRAAALLALVHAGIVLAAYLDFDWIALLRVTYLRSGTAAAIVLLVLLAASSERLLKVLDWRLHRPLHRLSIVAVALAFHHLILAPFASRWWTLVMFSVLAALLAVRLVPAGGRGVGDKAER